MKKSNIELMQDQLHALVDGRLSAGEKTRTLTQLDGRPVVLETLQAWQAQRDALRALHRSMLEDPVPETLLGAARRSQEGQQQIGQWCRWGGMAAAVVLAFGMGRLSHGLLGGLDTLAMARGQQQSAQAFMRQASVAHAVFVPEVRHPVEVSAAQQEHLVQWLSKRLQKPLKVPVLAAQGYELVGGRLLPGDSGARAQFMFQNLSGLRVTLYLGAVDGQTSAPGKELEQAAFHYSPQESVTSFYWVEQGFGYALSGAVPREELMRLAQLVYQQL